MLELAEKLSQGSRVPSFFTENSEIFLRLHSAKLWSTKTEIFRKLAQVMKRPLFRYGNAFLVSFVFIAFRAALIPYIGVEPPVFQLFDFAVFAAALMGGFMPGLVATVVLAIASRLWFYEGTSTLLQMNFTEAFRYYTFGIEGFLISGVCFYLRKMFFFVDEGLSRLQAGLRREEQLRIENQFRQQDLAAAEISRARAVASLKESEEHLMLAISAAEMGTWDVAVSQDRIRYSRQAAVVFGAGTEAGDCGYREFLDRVFPDDLPAVRTRLTEILKGNSKAEFVVDFRTKKASSQDPHALTIRDRWLSVRGRAYFENEKPVRIIGIVVDVTARQEAHEAVLRLKNEAEESNFAKTRFLANISHEIRTPLGAILGFAELMLDPSQNDHEREDCLHTILRNGESLRHVIDDILDVVTIETEKLTVTKRKFSVRDLVDDLAASLLVSSRQKGIELEFKFAADVPHDVESDPLRLRQILENVIGNAIKFTSIGRVLVEVAIHDALTTHRQSLLEFRISDTGVGMSEEQRSRAFQMFSQGNSAFDREFGGSGLGLFLSRRLAQELGGDLTLLQTCPGKGSTFQLRVDSGLEARPAPNSVTNSVTNSVPTNPLAPEKLSSVDAPPLGGMKVLIVDDAPDNCILIARYLRKAGAETQSAENGLTGMSDAQSHDYDVVLMDLQMPILDGYKAIESLREAHYDKPIVAITAHALKGERERCLNMGADEFLQKPVDRGELIRVVEQYRHDHCARAEKLKENAPVTISP